jgi:hypothetical protein
LLAAGLVLWVAAAQAQSIYSCVDSHGRRLTSDRPIRECLDREQKVLNADGSPRQVVGPSMTAEERAAFEEAERARMVAEGARRDAVRQDRNLMARYRNEEAHQRARESALEPTVAAIKSGERRLDDLGKERKQLDEEVEFFKGKALPRKLKQQFEQNETAVAAQRGAIEQHRQEMQRINALFDEELGRLKKLWAGALPGTLGSKTPLTKMPAAKAGTPLSPASSSATR